MGTVISSSAKAAAESLADDVPTENTSTANSNNTEASSPPSNAAFSAAATSLQSQHIIERPIDSGGSAASSPLIQLRRTPRKSQPTDFYSPSEKANEIERSRQDFMEVLDTKWEGRRQELIQYKNMHETFFVSPTENVKLSKWAENQRQSYRRGEMSEERVKLLRKIGFFDENRKSPMKKEKDEEEKEKQGPVKKQDEIVDSKKKSFDVMWEENRQDLIAYKDEHNTFFVSPRANKKLARWAENQRQSHRRGELSEPRVQLLREIQFFDEQYRKSPMKKVKMQKSSDEMWKGSLQALIDYKEQHGTFSFSSKSKLGRWIENQKRANKLGNLREERIKLLQEIGLLPLNKSPMIGKGESRRELRKRKHPSPARAASPSKKISAPSGSEEEGKVRIDMGRHMIDGDLDFLV